MTTQDVKTEAEFRTQADIQALMPPPYGPIVLRLHPAVELTDDLLAALSAQNDALRLERNDKGELEILAPSSTGTGNQELSSSADLMVWARSDGTGVAFGPTAGFTLRNGAVRAPDASWILRSRLAVLTEEQRTGFWRIAPDFVMEIRSSSDTLAGIQHKVAEYIENGVRLGWLIDSIDHRRRVYVYRPGVEVEVLERPESISGDPELPGFTLDLKPIWEPDF